MNRPLAASVLAAVAVAGAGLAGCSAWGGDAGSHGAAATAVETPPATGTPTAAGTQTASGSPAAAGAQAAAGTPTGRVLAATSPPPAQPPPAGQRSLETSTVHFTTPQAAMEYLAAAYNNDDLTALGHVTTPRARADLLGMRSEAVNLRLQNCSRRPVGDYVCQFAHDYPSSLHRSGHGHAVFLAGPADKPGWYMTVLKGCG